MTRSRVGALLRAALIASPIMIGGVARAQDAPAEPRFQELWLRFEEKNPDFANEPRFPGPRAKAFDYGVFVSGHTEHGKWVFQQDVTVKNSSFWDWNNDPRDTGSTTYVPGALATTLDGAVGDALSAGALAPGQIATTGSHPDATPFELSFRALKGKLVTVRGLMESRDGKLVPVLDEAHASLAPILEALVNDARNVTAQDAASSEIKGKVSVDPATGKVSIKDGKHERVVTNEPFAALLKGWAGEKVDLLGNVNDDGSVTITGMGVAVEGKAAITTTPNGSTVVNEGLKANKDYLFTITGMKDGALEVEVEDQKGLAEPRRAYVAPSSVLIGEKRASDLLPSAPAVGFVQPLSDLTPGH